MFTKEITAKHYLKTAEKWVHANGTVELYTKDELDELVEAGMLVEHREKLNEILIIRAQDVLRQTLVEEDPEKKVMRELKRIAKEDPARFAEILKANKLEHLSK